MIERTCCFIPEAVPGGPAVKPCDKPAEWELIPSTSRHEFVDSCTDHVGHLLDDAPDTLVRPLRPRGGMGGDPGLKRMT